MGDLAKFLGAETGVLVRDHTNSIGAYRFSFEWAPTQPASNVTERQSGQGLSPGDMMALIRALNRQLGLTIQPSTEVVEEFVVEDIEPPSAD